MVKGEIKRPSSFTHFSISTFSPTSAFIQNFQIKRDLQRGRLNLIKLTPKETLKRYANGRGGNDVGGEPHNTKRNSNNISSRNLKKNKNKYRSDNDCIKEHTKIDRDRGLMMMQRKSYFMKGLQTSILMSALGATTNTKWLSLLQAQQAQASMLKSSLSLSGGKDSTLSRYLRPSMVNALESDEYEYDFDPTKELGLVLEELISNRYVRTFVKGLVPGSQASQKDITLGSFLVAVNGKSLEGFRKSTVAKMIKEEISKGNKMQQVTTSSLNNNPESTTDAMIEKPFASSSLVLTFRDSTRFMELLQKKNSDNQSKSVANKPDGNSPLEVVDEDLV